VNAASGCDECPDGRDKYSGWGSLDVAKAVEFLNSGNPLPPSDQYEPNDSAPQAHKLWGKRPAFHATLDYWDDPVDAYRVRLLPGQRLSARFAARWANASVRMTLWRPGVKALRGRAGIVAHTKRAGKTQQFSYRAAHGGWYDLELVTVSHGGGGYSLNLTKS